MVWIPFIFFFINTRLQSLLASFYDWHIQSFAAGAECAASPRHWVSCGGCLQHCLILEQDCGISAWWDSWNKDPRCHLQPRGCLWSAILLTSPLLFPMVTPTGPCWNCLVQGLPTRQQCRGGKGWTHRHQVQESSPLRKSRPLIPVIPGLHLTRRLSSCPIFGIRGEGTENNRVTHAWFDAFLNICSPGGGSTESSAASHRGLNWCFLCSLVCFALHCPDHD